MSRELPLAAGVGIVLGAAIGVGGYTFVYAKGASYLTNDPAACANCHIMRDQYDGWVRSSHRAVAGCNDCHTPPGLLAKYFTKASNGFWHSFYFTTGRHPDPVRIRPPNRQITEKACRGCHAEAIAHIDLSHQPAQELQCLLCHNSVGHLEGLGQHTP